MEKKVCCVTGHRNLPQNQVNYVKAALLREIEKAVADGFTCFMSGFAEGVDQYFVEMVMEKQKDDPSLELIAVIPYQKRLDSLRAKGRTTSAMPADVADKPVLCLCSDLGSSYSRCLPSLTNQWQIIFFVPHTAGNNCSGFSPDSFKEIT